MQINKKISIIITFISVLLCLSACESAGKSELSSEVSSSSSEVSEESFSSEESFYFSSEVDDDTTSTSTENSTQSESEINADHVIEAYDNFKTFDDYWYKGGNADAMTEEIIKYNGLDYCRYETDEIKSFEEFKNTVLSIISENLWSQWQSTVEYIDMDGAIYGPVNFGRGADSSYAGFEGEAVQVAEHSFELVIDHYYFATAFIEDASEDDKVLRGRSTLLYEKINDNWVFTSSEYETIEISEG